MNKYIFKNQVNILKLDHFGLFQRQPKPDDSVTG